MPDFDIRSDAVDVQALLEEIRAAKQE